MRIVFHGANAANFSAGFAERLGPGHEVRLLSDALDGPGEVEAYQLADVIIGIAFKASLPRPQALRLYHLPAAGYDAVALDALPPGVSVCNCFGHETAIAEYVFAALLARQVPLAEAEARLRQGEWPYWSGAPNSTHGEISGKTIGLLGYGHIGKAIATRAKAFGMPVIVANRSSVATDATVSASFGLDQLADFAAACDIIVVSLPHNPQTTGLVDAPFFAAMRPDAVIINVGRGPIIDAEALYAALAGRRIGGAIIDTWYQYPSSPTAKTLPSALPFHTLPNVVMTPHMSGWTEGTIRRRQDTIIDNIARLARKDGLTNVVHVTAS